MHPSSEPRARQIGDREGGREPVLVAHRGRHGVPERLLVPEHEPAPVGVARARDPLEAGEGGACGHAGRRLRSGRAVATTRPNGRRRGRRPRVDREHVRAEQRADLVAGEDPPVCRRRGRHREAVGIGIVARARGRPDDAAPRSSARSSTPGSSGFGNGAVGKSASGSACASTTNGASKPARSSNAPNTSSPTPCIGVYTIRRARGPGRHACRRDVRDTPRSRRRRGDSISGESGCVRGSRSRDRPPRCRPRSRHRRAARSASRLRRRPCNRCRARGCGSRSPSRPRPRRGAAPRTRSPASATVAVASHTGIAGGREHRRGVARERARSGGGGRSRRRLHASARPASSIHRASPDARSADDREVHAVRARAERAAESGGAEREPAVEPRPRARRRRRPRAALRSSARVSGSGSAAIHSRTCPASRRRHASLRHQRARRARTSSASGRAPRCEITSAAASEPEPRARLQVGALRVAVQEPGRVQVAGAGRVDEPVDGVGVDHVRLVAGDDHRAVLGAGERGDASSRAGRLRVALLEVALVQRADLGFVREEDVDLLGDERPPLGPVPVDAERVGERRARPRCPPRARCGRPCGTPPSPPGGPTGSPRGTRPAPQRRGRRRRPPDRGTPTQPR